jgi:hypothetical protein
VSLAYPQLKRNQQRGSKPRCHLLTHGTPEIVATRLTDLVAPFASIAPIDHWMPQGFDQTDEATLPEAARLLPEEVRIELKRWWLAVASSTTRTPNWDMASTCTIEGQPGILLIEAKAHAQELIKEETGRKNIQPPVSGSARRNLLRIDWAIRDASIALSEDTGLPWALSRDWDYQMSNRFAWSWKLAELGIPVVLVYLGFLKANDMDTSEKGLETLIMRHMTGTDGLAAAPNRVAESGRALRRHRLHRRQRAGLRPRPRARRAAALRLPARHPARGAFKKLAMADANDARDINRLKFLARLSAEIGKRGVIDVLRKGVEHGPLHFDLFYGTPSPGNARAEALHAENRFSITRQLAYSMDETRRALDLCLFINGLPIATFELKNSLTKQTVEDAVQQYKRDRDPRERLFEFGRCVVHFAVDDSEVRMCTELRGKGSWFLPFNKGSSRRRGQPAQPARPEDRLPVEGGAHAGGADQHPRELRADRRGEGPAHRQEEAQAGLAALPPARRGAQALADVRAHGAGGAT